MIIQLLVQSSGGLNCLLWLTFFQQGCFLRDGFTNHIFNPLPLGGLGTDSNPRTPTGGVGLQISNLKFDISTPIENYI